MKKYIIILLFLMSPCFASQDFYSFDTQEGQQRFNKLTSQFRCLVCQNQTIAESNASLAVDLREQIYQKILHHQSDKEIMDYLVMRYGDFILYRPPLLLSTTLLWFGPSLCLFFGVGFLFYYVKAKK